MALAWPFAQPLHHSTTPPRVKLERIYDMAVLAQRLASPAAPPRNTPLRAAGPPRVPVAPPGFPASAARSARTRPHVPPACFVPFRASRKSVARHPARCLEVRARRGSDPRVQEPHVGWQAERRGMPHERAARQLHHGDGWRGGGGGPSRVEAQTG
jgi:hypothetical protein